jgi:hypothetical protein
MPLIRLASGKDGRGQSTGWHAHQATPSVRFAEESAGLPLQPAQRVDELEILQGPVAVLQDRIL